MKQAELLVYRDDTLTMTLGAQVHVVRSDQIERIDLCVMALPEQGDETFHILYVGPRFWLVGPFADGGLTAMSELLRRHPEIPTRPATVLKLPWKLRESGLLGLRLFPIARLGVFPLDDLPDLDTGEPRVPI